MYLCHCICVLKENSYIYGLCMYQIWDGDDGDSGSGVAGSDGGDDSDGGHGDGSCDGGDDSEYQLEDDTEWVGAWVQMSLLERRDECSGISIASCIV